MAQVSPPTVESRLKRMMDTGLIKRIAPILDHEKVRGGLTALITLKGPQAKLTEAAKQLMELEEVRGIYLSVGEAGMIIRVHVDDAEALQEFLSTHIGGTEGVTVAASNVITRIMKEEQPMVLKAGFTLRLRCDYCGGEVTGPALTLKVAGRERYLCCKGCLASYKEKYGKKIRTLQRAAGGHHHTV